MEELLFRGLFLNRYDAVIGRHLSIVATSLVFALAHIQFTYTQELPLFFTLLFMLGIAWATIMRMTDSIIASTLFHAGVYVILMTAIFTGTAIF
jgi:membrane protease YdiL (CAAX protease family)